MDNIQSASADDRPGTGLQYRVASALGPDARRRLRPVAARLVGSIVGVKTSQPVIALTFDDGPHPEITPELLDVLARRRARATFFMVASRARAYPDIVRETQARGHEVALHGRDHVSLIDCSGRTAFNTIWRGKRDLESLTTRRLRYFRPPLGDQDLRAWIMARAAGMDVVHWSAHARDWLDHSLTRHLSEAAELAAGGVMLLHDGDPLPNTTLGRAELVDEVVGRLTQKGLSSVPVGELLRCGRPIRHFRMSPRRKD